MSHPNKGNEIRENIARSRTSITYLNWKPTQIGNRKINKWNQQ